MEVKPPVSKLTTGCHLAQSALNTATGGAVHMLYYAPVGNIRPGFSRIGNIADRLIIMTSHSRLLFKLSTSGVIQPQIVSMLAVPCLAGMSTPQADKLYLSQQT